MAPKRDQSEKDALPGKKKARKSITLEQQKMDILRRYDRGESTADIRNALNLPESTLRTIRKDREKIMEAVKAGAGSCSIKVSSGQSNIMVRTEKMLVTRMDHRKRQGLNVTFDDTKKKAMECFNHLKQEMGPVSEFSASTGWFYKFKTRYGFHNVKLSGEAKSADEDAAASYPDCLRAIIEEGGYKPQQVFNMDEMGQQWKKMPDCTYITREKCAPGFKAFKDRFTLLLGANLTGDCKLKPVIVYHAENPRALLGHAKTSLPVHWYSNSSGWLTRHIFENYSKTSLVQVFKYCTSRSLPFHILMVFDNTPALGLYKIGEDDVNSLLEAIGEELSTEDLSELEKQRRQLEEVVEAEQHPTMPLTTKQLTVKIRQCFFGIINQGMDYLEEVDPDFQSGLLRAPAV